VQYEGSRAFFAVAGKDYTSKRYKVEFKEEGKLVVKVISIVINFIPVTIVPLSVVNAHCTPKRLSDDFITFPIARIITSDLTFEAVCPGRTFLPFTLRSTSLPSPMTNCGNLIQFPAADPFACIQKSSANAYIIPGSQLTFREFYPDLRQKLGASKTCLNSIVSRDVSC
jgi:hypothetical protein